MCCYRSEDCLQEHIAYSQRHKLAVAKQVADFITGNQEIRLLVINNLTNYFKESKYNNYARGILKEVIGILSKVCAQNRIALICTGDANATSKGVVARPVGGTYLKHAFNDNHSIKGVVIKLIV